MSPSPVEISLRTEISKVPPPRSYTATRPALLFVQPVSERGGRWLVDQAKNFKASNLARVFRGLALGIVKVSGDGDDRAIDGLAEISLGPILEFAKNERGNLGRREEFVAEFDANDIFASRIDAEREQFQFALDVGDASAHQPLYGINAALRLREQATPGWLAYDDAAVRVQAYDRGTQRAAIRPRNTLRRSRLRIGVRDEAVGRAEIDSYDSSHIRQVLLQKPAVSETAATTIPFERYSQDSGYTSGDSAIR